jgi:hypothetical protein
VITPVASDSSFSVSVPPGEIRIRALGLPAGIAAKWMVNGQEAPCGELLIGPGEQASARVDLFANTREVKGVVRDAHGNLKPGAAVVAFPRDSRQWRCAQDTVTVWSTDANARFDFRISGDGDSLIAAVGQQMHVADIAADALERLSRYAVQMPDTPPPSGEMSLIAYDNEVLSTAPR